MATYENMQVISLEAGADLSAFQYSFVDVSSSGQAVLATSGGDAIGILLNNPASNAAASIAIAGRAPLKIGAGVTAGGYAQATTNGLGVTATATNRRLARFLETHATANAIVPVLLVRGAAQA